MLMLPRKAHSRLLASLALVAAGVLAGGCGDDNDTADQPAASTPAAPAMFAVTATSQGKKKKALEFPSTVKAGLVTITLTNQDTIARAAGIARLVGDHTVDEYHKVVSKDGGPIPDWIEDGGGVYTVPPGETRSVTQVLAPGKYAITDNETTEGDGEGESLADLGAKGEFTVTGPASDAELPAQPATLTAKDYSYKFNGFKAGKNMVRFENTGMELHHAVIFPINEGKTIADAKKMFTSDGPPKGPPPVDFDKTLSTQVIDGGIAQNIELDLAAGKYAVVCFIQDRKGGAPHVAKGMITELAIE
jgi:hypothetical protein